MGDPGRRAVTVEGCALQPRPESGEQRQRHPIDHVRSHAKESLTRCAPHKHRRRSRLSAGNCGVARRGRGYALDCPTMDRWIALVSGLLLALPALASGDEAPDVGDVAPAFDLPGTDGNSHRLVDHRGKRAVVVAWFPKASTPG